jgi:hypothetical protein
MVGGYLKYLCSSLSSLLFEYAYKHIFSSIELGETGYQYNKHALVELPIKPIDRDIVLSNDDIFRIYDLTESEIKFISSSVRANKV